MIYNNNFEENFKRVEIKILRKKYEYLIEIKDYKIDILN